MVYVTGYIYEGEWYQDVKKGKGKLMLGEETIHDGIFPQITENKQPYLNA
jgi:hypothetical protein